VLVDHGADMNARVRSHSCRLGNRIPPRTGRFSGD
jgi:hypothetical protein